MLLLWKEEGMVMAKGKNNLFIKNNKGALKAIAEYLINESDVEEELKLILKRRWLEKDGGML
jgi:hypothetical protein